MRQLFSQKLLRKYKLLILLYVKINNYYYFACNYTKSLVYKVFVIRETKFGVSKGVRRFQVTENTTILDFVSRLTAVQINLSHETK